MSEDQTKYYETVILAEEIEVWMQSPIGRYVLEQRDAVEKAVMDSFRTVDASNTKKVRDLQRALDAANTAVQWLKDAVVIGRQNDQILRAERNNHE